jgi:hypothetical protein
MAWTAPSDHAATVVSVVEWNNFHGISGNCAYLKAIADAPMKAQGDGGTIYGGRAKLNFISGANVVVTVADASGDDRVNVTLASSGGNTPTQSASSAITSIVTSATQSVKGAYAQLIASTGFAVIGIYININSTVGAENIFLDISTGGAGAESVKISDMLIGGNGIRAYIPFSIAISTRIAARASNESSANARTNSIGITIFG